MTREEHIAKADELLTGKHVEGSYPGSPGWNQQPTELDVERALAHATLAAAMPRRPWWRRGGAR